MIVREPTALPLRQACTPAPRTLVATSTPTAAALDRAAKNTPTACAARDRKEVPPTCAGVARDDARRWDAPSLVPGARARASRARWRPVPPPVCAAASAAGVKTFAAGVAGGARSGRNGALDGRRPGPSLGTSCPPGLVGCGSRADVVPGGGADGSNPVPGRRPALGREVAARTSLRGMPQPQGRRRWCRHLPSTGSHQPPGALRGMVEQCSFELKLALFPDEVTAIAAVLNRDHYRFK